MAIGDQGHPAPRHQSHRTAHEPEAHHRQIQHPDRRPLRSEVLLESLRRTVLEIQPKLTTLELGVGGRGKSRPIGFLTPQNFGLGAHTFIEGANLNRNDLGRPAYPPGPWGTWNLNAEQNPRGLRNWIPYVLGRSRA